LDREEAIFYVVNHTIINMSNSARYEVLLNWWGVDEQDGIFGKLPELLKHELLNSDDPPMDVTDEKYNPLIIEALKTNYMGVRNEF
jgi:hypothetical protein